MKPELERITATLTRLQQPAPGNLFPADAAAAVPPGPSCSFQITLPFAAPSYTALTVAAENLAEGCESGNSLGEAALPAPNLPRFKPVSFSSHRHATSPALPLSLLKEIEATVIRWERELRQVSQQIHELYQAGPIVDGWLESQPHPNATEEHTPLSHIEITRLLDSVQELLNTTPTHLVTHASPRAGYRLCRLDADGQMQCLPCPAEQVPAISLAIARHQKLRQLLSQQHLLETRLNQLAQSLVGVHSSLPE